jgi:pimeloyl-ACP methyl ester carboxylesterase
MGGAVALQVALNYPELLKGLILSLGPRPTSTRWRSWLNGCGIAPAVRYVLAGSVRMSGNRIRMTVQLVDARTGGHIWAERYDREMTDVFAAGDA